MKIYYVDGKFVFQNQAVIPVDDLAILRGYGVFDLIRTYQGKPYFLKEHIERLENSAKEIGLSLPWSNSEIKDIVFETLKKNENIDEANIRIVITGGSSTDFFNPQGNPRLLVLITEIKKLPEEWYQTGVKVVTHPLERDIPGAKVISYVPAAIALKNAKQMDAIEAIYINRNKDALEGTTSNLFAFFNKTLVTPEKGILKGITRQVILQLAKKYFTVEQRNIQLEELLKADELFISGTNKGIVPVIQIDDTPIGNKQPGKHTKTIINALEQHTEDFINR
ncbi:MAG: branched-chain amino acid aminotransferase [Desulfobacteraceae bacterium]|nr:branched-chain amino acid aminotransferase [Desulfobacteraceae bacterium]